MAGLLGGSSSIVVGFADSYRHLLTKPQQREAHQGNRHEKEEGRAIYVLEMEQGGSEAHGKQQRGANPRSECQACCLAQEDESPSQTREVRFEMGSRVVLIRDLVQMPDALHDGVQTAQKDRYEGCDRAKHERRRRGL